MSTRPIRILCVDDHAFLVEGLKARVAREEDMEVVGHLTCADDLVKSVRELGADIVLMDIEMPGADPFEALADLKRQDPDVKAIMLSAYVRDGYIDAAYQAGAWGYLAKHEAPDAVIQGIRDVARGDLAFSRDVLDRSRPAPVTQPG